jgi:hypothetical protein
MRPGERETALNPRRWAGWFRIRWPADGQGVELVTRIPGYLDKTTRHSDWDAAERAAAAIYDEYRAAIDALRTGDRT